MPALTFCAVDEHVEAVEDGEGPDEQAARQERLPPAPNPPHAAKKHALLTFNVVMIPLMFGSTNDNALSSGCLSLSPGIAHFLIRCIINLSGLLKLPSYVCCWTTWAN